MTTLVNLLYVYGFEFREVTILLTEKIVLRGFCSITMKPKHKNYDMGIRHLFHTILINLNSNLNGMKNKRHNIRNVTKFVKETR